MLGQGEIAHYFSSACVRMADYKGLSGGFSVPLLVEIAPPARALLWGRLAATWESESSRDNWRNAGATG